MYSFQNLPKHQGRHALRSSTSAVVGGSKTRQVGARGTPSAALAGRAAFVCVFEGVRPSSFSSHTSCSCVGITIRLSSSCSLHTGERQQGLTGGGQRVAAAAQAPGATAAASARPPRPATAPHHPFTPGDAGAPACVACAGGGPARAAPRASLLGHRQRQHAGLALVHLQCQRDGGAVGGHAAELRGSGVGRAGGAGSGGEAWEEGRAVGQRAGRRRMTTAGRGGATASRRGRAGWWWWGGRRGCRGQPALWCQRGRGQGRPLPRSRQRPGGREPAAISRPRPSISRPRPSISRPRPSISRPRPRARAPGWGRGSGTSPGWPRWRAWRCRRQRSGPAGPPAPS